MVLRFEGTRRPGLDCDAVGTGADWNGGRFSAVAVLFDPFPPKDSIAECLEWCAIAGRGLIRGCCGGGGDGAVIVVERRD